MRVLIQNQQSYRSINKVKIRKAARKVLSLLKYPITELSILFVDNERMQQLNAAYRGRKKTTDVLSFDAELPFLKTNPFIGNKLQQPALGDVVINTQIAASRAKTTEKDFYYEIYHLLVHGTLHLLGYDHEGSRHGARIMRKKEREILDALKKIC
jgi:probable rRNA maturation factor